MQKVSVMPVGPTRLEAKWAGKIGSLTSRTWYAMLKNTAKDMTVSFQYPVVKTVSVKQ